MATVNNSVVIIKKITAIQKAAQKVSNAVQECAVQCAVHAVRHGDVTLATRLVDAIGKGMRKASLRAWFEVNTCMYIPSGKTEFAYDGERAKKMAKESDAELTESLMAIHWEEAKPEAAVVSVLDVGEAFDKFLKRLEKQAGEAGIEVKHRELLAALKTASAQFHGAAVTAAINGTK